MLISAITFLIISVLLQTVFLLKRDMATLPLEKTAYRTGTYGSLLLTLFWAGKTWPDLELIFDIIALTAITVFMVLQIKLARQMWKGEEY